MMTLARTIDHSIISGCWKYLPRVGIAMITKHSKQKIHIVFLRVERKGGGGSSFFDPREPTYLHNWYSHLNKMEKVFERNLTLQ